MMEDDFLSAGQERRLPVFLLLDSSSSMSGDPIVALNEGVTMLHRELMNDPRARETVHICVITFADKATQYTLTEIDSFDPPQLIADGVTAMGSAFTLLAETIEQELRVNTATQHGDYRPLVFLLTDGVPTDEYRDGIQRIAALRGSKRPTIIALGCGSGVNTAMLHELTDNVYLMQNVTPASLRQYFQWISGSIVQTSSAASNGSSQPTIMRPPTDIPGIQYSPD